MNRRKETVNKRQESEYRRPESGNKGPESGNKGQEPKNNRQVGTEYENMAARYLESKGLRILESNFRCRLGEIDLIAKDHSVIVFFEVKYRSSEAMGVPQEAVDYRKQSKICKVADYYRMIHHLGEYAPFRFDVISICDHHIKWIPNAFPYQWRK